MSRSAKNSDNRAVWPLVRKELRGFFHSPVAVIFLAVFLIAVMVSFFFVDKFFARNLADIRPLFDRLPVLLIFLVAALTMRAWSEEQKTGTLEVLMTLPIPEWKLALGKLLAGFILIAIALGLTLGVPITVAILGDLDWGPVMGGYLAALLLAGAYLSIGLCLSALTDNQIVALVTTALACLVLYLVGTDVTTRGMGYHTAEILRSIGTGARFESVARGVIDIRDLVYWLSLIGLFFSINVYILRTKSWAGGQLPPDSKIRPRRNAAKLAIALVAANMVLVNLWIAPIRGVRVDLTADNAYKLSPVTENLLRSLDEPLLIRGYFSEKTHPLVAPMVGEIRDRLEEYAAAGGDKVRIEIIDPTDNEEVEKEAAELYNIETLSFRFRDRHGASVVNAYFHLLVQYGDQHEVLGFDDLVEVRPLDVSDISLELNNFEYTLTGAIKKAALGFSSLETLLATLETAPKLTFYTSAQTPPGLEKLPETIKKVVEELAADAGTAIEFEQVTPTQADVEPLARKYGLQPRLVLSGGQAQAFYFDLVFEVGDRAVILAPPADGDENAIKRSLIEAIKRVSPGFTKTVGLVTPPPVPVQQPQMPGQPPPQPIPPQSFQNLRAALSKSYEVRGVNLASGIDDSIDVLILAGPDNLQEKELRAVDQFLMRGGALIALVGRYRINPQSAQTLELQPVDPGMGELLKSYGFDVESKLIMDTSASSFIVPIARPGRRPALFQAESYPFAVRVDADQLAGHVATNPLNAAVFHYASPVVLMTPQAQAADDERTVESKALVKTSKSAWTKVDANIQPDFVAFPDKGFGALDVADDAKGPFVLAAVATGSFTSHFARAAGEGGEADNPAAPGDGDDGEQRPMLERSPPDSRIAVVGSSSFVEDLVLRLAEGSDAQEVDNNIDLVLNLVDWGLADTDLLEIRARGAHTRTLTLEESSRFKWELINYLIALLGLGLIIGLVFLKRRNLEPMQLDRDARHRWTAAAGSAAADDGGDGDDAPAPAAAPNDDDEEE